ITRASTTWSRPATRAPRWRNRLTARRRQRPRDPAKKRSQRMKVYEIERPGSIDALRPAERPRPAPGHGQVLVRVRACSLNYRDLAVVRGTYARGLKLPLIPLSDGAGEVVEVGPGVTRFAVGDRWPRSSCRAGSPADRAKNMRARRWAA